MNKRSNSISLGGLPKYSRELETIQLALRVEQISNEWRGIQTLELHVIEGELQSHGIRRAGYIVLCDHARNGDVCVDSDELGCPGLRS